MPTRWRAVDLFDQHATRRFSSGARAVDEHARNGAADLRSIRLRIRETRHELTVTAREVGGERAVDEDHRRAHRSGGAARGVHGVNRGGRGARILRGARYERPW